LSAAIRPAAQQRNVPFSNPTLPAPRRSRRHTMPPAVYPLVVICAVQAGLSLSLVWSNTAYIDEADYLWVGRLEIAHLLHGTSWPSAYADHLFSGSPIIYPPIGTAANMIGGVAGARILGLFFMLGATVLLYLTATRLIGYRGAIISAALWALSEPAIRLAFATFDPLSVVLTSISAWLIVQASCRHHRSVFVLMAALALATANVTTYSSIVIDPVVIAFAFLAWLPLRARRAALYTGLLTVASAVLFTLLMAVSRSWSGLLFTVVTRNIADYQSIVAILSDSWGYAGILMVLAAVGGITACNTETVTRASQLVLLALAAIVVPAAQIHDQTGWSLDKHLAYGIWFSAIAAGYGCDRLIQWLPGTSRQLVAVCCTIGIAYVGLNGWQSAWNRFHSWPNAQAFIAAIRPVVAQSRGLIYVPGHEANIAEYYTTQGGAWRRWSASLSLNPVAVPRDSWDSYYSTQLHNGNYNVIALFYATTFSSAPDLPESVLLKGDAGTNRKLLGLVGDNSGEPGLSALTLALKQDHEYRLEATGPYNSSHSNGVYVIWQKKA
jgi:hypothetical protein